MTYDTKTTLYEQTRIMYVYVDLSLRQFRHVLFSACLHHRGRYKIIIVDVCVRGSQPTAMPEVFGAFAQPEEPGRQAEPILKYLGLPDDYEPHPSSEPIEFIRKHLRQLPPPLLQPLSRITTAKQRSVVPGIRNRRLNYTRSQPPALGLDEARRRWPTLWSQAQGGGGGGSALRNLQIEHGRAERAEEKRWADSAFLEGRKQHVGKLGALLGEFAEEREAESARVARRAAAQDFVPEEDSDASEDEDTPGVEDTEETEDEKRESFERLIRERFIYGLLDVSCILLKSE